MKVPTLLKNLNHVNGADLILFDYANKLLTEVEGPLLGCEMGIAYGGGVEGIGSLWKDRGIIYGFDVFEAMHPVHLASDPALFEATCMQYWYDNPEYGKDGLHYDFQRKTLDGLGLDNVILVKGEVHPDSCKDIPYLNYAFLDMDIVFSMQQGYAAVKNKVVPGGYLFLHDTQNINTVGDWYKAEILGTDGEMWEEIGNWPSQMLVGLKRK